MAVDIELKGEDWTGINKIRVPLDGGGTQDFSLGGSVSLQTKSKTYTPTTSQQTDTITPDTGYDGLDEVDITVNAVPTATASSSGIDSEYTLPASMRKWRARGQIDYGTGGFVSGTQYGDYVLYNAVPTGTTVTPTESQQTIGGADYMMEGAVTVDAISSSYVGSGITRRDDDDITGAWDGQYYTVNVPSGYYPSSAEHYVSENTETVSATKSAVSNNSLTVTPSVANTGGYTPSRTVSGTAVTVRAIELVSGNMVITQNGSGIDVSTYSSVTVNVTGGGVGTLLATKSLGTISTSSTSATDTGQSLTVSGINSYDALIVETSVDTVVNNRHTCTVAVILFAATSNRNTKSGATIATLKQNYKISSSGVTTQRAGTTAYGIYPNSITISNGTATIPMYQRYNSTSTGTINGTYTARVYGLNLFDLIGG